MNDDTFVLRGSTPPDTAVLGVVVEIPQPWSQLFTDWRAKVGDDQAGVVPPHVTLLPPTPVSKGTPSVSQTWIWILCMGTCSSSATICSKMV